MQKLPLIKGKRVTVFGLGISGGGVGTARFLASMGAKEIIVTDLKRREELAPSLSRLASVKGITYVLGQHRPEDFSRVDLVVKNPIIPWTNEYVGIARKNGVPVTMDSALFFESCPNPIIGVTGTRGKTTTSSMIAHILESAGMAVARVGIGQGPVLGAVERIRPGEIVVFELSSWRLSGLREIGTSPRYAVVTNVYPDHLNYYRTMEAYIRDKCGIFEFQGKDGVVVFNADNGISADMAKRATGRVRLFSRLGHEADLVVSDGVVISGNDGSAVPIFRADELPIPGAHNMENAMAAAAISLELGVPADRISTALRSFPSIPHRLEFVALRRGVRYFNDSAATSPDGAVAGLRSFEPGRVVLIAGGTDKNLRFGEFADEILSGTRDVVLLPGTGTEALSAEISARLRERGGSRELNRAGSMEEAVARASEIASDGDVVLLSPGAASFGLFRNEFDRGDRFREAVLALPDGKRL